MSSASIPAGATAFERPPAAMASRRTPIAAAARNRRGVIAPMRAPGSAPEALPRGGMEQLVDRIIGAGQALVHAEIDDRAEEGRAERTRDHPHEHLRAGRRPALVKLDGALDRHQKRRVAKTHADPDQERS